jgi:hypothetical protein
MDISLLPTRNHCKFTFWSVPICADISSGKSPLKGLRRPSTSIWGKWSYFQDPYGAGSLGSSCSSLLIPSGRPTFFSATCCWFISLDNPENLGILWGLGLCARPGVIWGICNTTQKAKAEALRKWKVEDEMWVTWLRIWHKIKILTAFLAENGRCTHS